MNEPTPRDAFLDAAWAVMATSLWASLLALEPWGGRARTGLGLALTVAGGWAGSWVVTAQVWAAAALMPIGAMYVCRKALSDRVLMPRDSGAAALLWAVFAAVSVVVLRDSGLARADMPSAFIALLVSVTLVPLAAVALAPWSFSLLRHR